MMRLFSGPLASIQFLAVCLGSWGGLSHQADAQTSLPLERVIDRRPAATELLETTGTPVPLTEPFTYLEHKQFLTARKNVTVVSFPSKLLEQSSEIFFEDSDNDRNIGSVSLEIAEDEELGTEDESQTDEDEDERNGAIDDELGILRVRSQPIGIDSELGILRIRPTEDVPLEVEPEPTRQTTVFLTGRANVYGGNNLFRTPNPIDDRIYQTGIGVFAFPRIADGTNLLLSAEANLARYEDLSIVDYNELQFQAGIRQRLGQSSYGQLNWRYQDLSTPGSDSFFQANYVELLLSRRDILNNRTWLDTYYQARLSISDPKAFSRFTQIATGSINYGFDPQTRVSFLYQLFLDDYTEIERHDTYHQILAQFSHDLSSTTRLSLFTGFRFGRSSLSNVDFDDIIYGASINVNVPLF
ncbi:hypothetical protein Lepto7375DRAFT_4139 [Leptolyngbya sp. PCC 7375]|nr:hypothetical protein Lepto7375DRAFT_4139 [Leptolyngbya sp. PCC 7375]